jgi:hypothetical protein
MRPSVAKNVPAWSPRNTSSSSAGVGMGPAIERARSDAISSVPFGSLAFVSGPALLCPSRKRFFWGLNPTESRFRKSTDRMPSQTHALPPAEPTPALAALAEVFGGAHASPPQRQTAASFRCVKSAGAHAVMPRARQAPELSDRCAPRLAFPQTGPTRVSSSSWHDCVQQALALIAATTTTARSLGASAPRRLTRSREARRPRQRRRSTPSSRPSAPRRPRHSAARSLPAAHLRLSRVSEVLEGFCCD